MVAQVSLIVKLIIHKIVEFTQHFLQGVNAMTRYFVINAIFYVSKTILSVKTNQEQEQVIG